MLTRRVRSSPQKQTGVAEGAGGYGGLDRGLWSGVRAHCLLLRACHGAAVQDKPAPYCRVCDRDLATIEAECRANAECKAFTYDGA